MGNKRDPRKVTITEEPSLISDLQTRAKILAKNRTGLTIGLHRSGTKIVAGEEVPVEFEDCFPWEDGENLDDAESGDQYWGMLEAAGSVEIDVWETEI